MGKGGAGWWKRDGEKDRCIRKQGASVPRRRRRRGWLPGWLAGWLARWLAGWFVRSFVRSLVRSLGFSRVRARRSEPRGIDGQAQVHTLVYVVCVHVQRAYRIYVHRVFCRYSYVRTRTHALVYVPRGDRGDNVHRATRRCRVVVYRPRRAEGLLSPLRVIYPYPLCANFASRTHARTHCTRLLCRGNKNVQKGYRERRI